MEGLQWPCRRSSTALMLALGSVCERELGERGFCLGRLIPSEDTAVFDLEGGECVLSIKFIPQEALDEDSKGA